LLCHSFHSLFFLSIPPPPRSTLFPYTTLFRSARAWAWCPSPAAGGLRCPRPGSTRTAPRSPTCSNRGSLTASSPPIPCLSLPSRSEEHTSELQSPYDLVCRLLLEKKKKNKKHT